MKAQKHRKNCRKRNKKVIGEIGAYSDLSDLFEEDKNEKAIYHLLRLNISIKMFHK